MSTPIDFAIIPDSLDSLDADSVLGTEQLLKDLWRSADRASDVDHGAFASLVVRPAATLLEVARQTFATARRSSSFTALLSDPSGGSREMLDELALAYRVRRREGSLASGRIRVFSSEDIYTTIGLSDRFDANGHRFRVLAVQSARPTDDPVSTLADTQNLRPSVDGSGYYFFDIDVTATANGSAANLVKGTELDMPDGKPPYFVRAVVLETFTGGENDETDPSLVDRMRLGLSAKVLGSRLNMKSALLEIFPSIRDSSIIGAGDVEMSRDKHSVFPGSTGGYVDWYVGTTRQLQTGYFTTDRFYQVGENPDGSVDYLVYAKDEEISCAYAATAVQLESDLAYLEILDQEKAIQDTGADNDPIIHEIEETAYTRYQVLMVRFRAPKSLAGESIRVSVIHMPLIRDIQDWVLQCSQAPIGVDLLVKAAIPTTIQFSCVLHTPIGDEVDIDHLRNLVCDHVNHIPFGGLLSVSGLTALIHGNLPAGSYMTRPALFATTWLPSGEKVITQSEDVLEIDYPPYTTNRTTLFFCDANEVSFEQRYIERSACG